MQIFPVSSAAAEAEFFKLPLSIYKNDANWIQPLDKDVEEVFDAKKNKASIIYFNSSPYAEACANLFKDGWNRKKGEKFSINDENTIELKVNRRNQIGETITSKKAKVAGKEIIFIVAYGQAYLDILQSLLTINKTALIVMTSTFSFKKSYSS